MSYTVINPKEPEEMSGATCGHRHLTIEAAIKCMDSFGASALGYFGVIRDNNTNRPITDAEHHAAVNRG